MQLGKYNNFIVFCLLFKLFWYNLLIKKIWTSNDGNKCTLLNMERSKWGIRHGIIFKYYMVIIGKYQRSFVHVSHIVNLQMRNLTVSFPPYFYVYWSIFLTSTKHCFFLLYSKEISHTLYIVDWIVWILDKMSCGNYSGFYPFWITISLF